MLDTVGLSPNAKALAMALLMYLNDDGCCAPSRATLLEDLDCSDSSLARWARELEAAGLLYRSDAYAGRRTVWYAIVPSQLPQRTLAILEAQEAATSDSHSVDVEAQEAATSDSQTTERLSDLTGKAVRSDSPNPLEPTYTDNPYPSRAHEDATPSSPQQTRRDGSTSSKATRRRAAESARVSDAEARDWLSSLVARMPADAATRFMVEWPQLVEQDPTWDTVAVAAARKLLAKNHPAAVDLQRLLAGVATTMRDRSLGAA